MWAAAVLMAYAALIGTAGAIVLQRCSWTLRAPRLALLTWHSMTLSLLASLTLAALLMVSPGPETHADLHHLSLAGQSALDGDVAAVIPALWCLAVIASCGLLLLAAAAGTAHAVISARRSRRQHTRDLALIAEPDPTTGVIVIDHPGAAAYCIGGADRTVVITRGAQERLTASELHAVLAHEMAHLYGHHHLQLAIARGLRRGLPFIPLLRWAPHNLARWMEMAADDRAARGSTRRTVATAMVAMAEASMIPEPALGAGSVEVITRIDRLLIPEDPLGPTRRGGILATTTAIVFAPALMAAVFSLTALGLQACGPSGPGT